MPVRRGRGGDGARGDGRPPGGRGQGAKEQGAYELRVVVHQVAGTQAHLQGQGVRGGGSGGRGVRGGCRVVSSVGCTKVLDKQSGSDKNSTVAGVSLR